MKTKLNNAFRRAIAVAALAAPAAFIGTVQAASITVGPECYTAKPLPGAAFCFSTGITPPICVPIVMALPSSTYCATVTCMGDGAVTVSEGAPTFNRSCEIAKTVAFSAGTVCSTKITAGSLSLLDKALSLPPAGSPTPSPIELCLDVQK